MARLPELIHVLIFTVIGEKIDGFMVEKGSYQKSIYMRALVAAYAVIKKRIGVLI